MLINIVLDRRSGMYFMSLSSEGVLTTSDGWWGLSGEEEEQFFGGYWLLEDDAQFTAGVFQPTNADHLLRNIRETAEVELTQEQFQELVDLMNQITDDDFRGWAVGDSPWLVYVIHGESVFSYFLFEVYSSQIGQDGSPHMAELIRRIIRYSPIDIVSSPNWPRFPGSRS